MLRVRKESGWERVTPFDSAKRRALWMREEKQGDDLVALEMCAGREGDDAYARLEGDAAKAVRDVLETVQFGYDWDV